MSRVDCFFVCIFLLTLILSCCYPYSVNILQQIIYFFSLLFTLFPFHFFAQYNCLLSAEFTIHRFRTVEILTYAIFPDHNIYYLLTFSVVRFFVASNTVGILFFFEKEGNIVEPSWRKLIIRNCCI